MKRAFCAVILVVCMAAMAAVSRPASEPVRILTLVGDGSAMGKAHGQQLGETIRMLHARYLDGVFADPELKKKALVAAFMFRSQLRPEHRNEITALAEGAGIDPGVAMLGNCFLDLMPNMACSTVALGADASPDGVARFGRNVDFASRDIADKHSVLLIYKPAGKHQFAAVSWPGIIGVLSGMNEHGLTLANMEVDRRPAMPSAMPYVMLYRTILEDCKTVEEAIDLLNRTPRQSANNLMLMDAAGRRAVAEITPEKVVVRWGQDRKALLSTNHQRGTDQDAAGRCNRYDRLGQATRAQYGRIGVAEIQQMLADVAQGKMTLQSMIFEPSTRVMYLATGLEAGRRQFRKIDLEEHFGR